MNSAPVASATSGGGTLRFRQRGRLPVRIETVPKMGLAAQSPNWGNRKYTAGPDLRLYLPILGNLTQEGNFFDDPRLMQR